jgi:hypothetical protein
MLKLYKPQFIERIMTSPTGERYRVVFQINNVGGKAIAKVVSAEYIEERLAIASPEQLDIESEVLSLPCASVAVEVSTSYASPFTPVVSPFTSLLFFTSQPTRAPSVA